jgi:ketosteroid isomerase-like protein
MEAELRATLEEYAEAYCAKDVDRLMALFDGGDDISVIGTGADELCYGPAAIRELFQRNFREATAERFEWHWTKVTLREDTGVIATTLTIHLDLDGRKVAVPLRWTVTLHRKDGSWRWLHRHASSAAGSQDEGTAYPMDRSGRSD